MENWVNNTEKDVNVSAVDADGFYTVSSTNPIIAECEPTILKSEVKVNMLFSLFLRLASYVVVIGRLHVCGWY